MSYQSFPYTLVAGEQRTIHASGSNLHVLYATGAFQVSLNGDGKGYLEQGQGFAGIPFQNVEVWNDGDEPITVVLGFSTGEIVDSRLNIQGGQIGVTDPGEGAESFSDIVTALGLVNTGLNAVIAALREDQQLRAPLMTLDGASYAQAINTTTEVVSAAANTDGVIIRLAALSPASNNAYVSVGGNLILNNYSSGYGRNVIENVFVPAGRAIVISSNGASPQTTYIWYEVL